MGDSFALWGKSGKDGVPHPLLLHMLDSGMVARALLQAPQWRRIRRLLVRLSGLDGDTLESSVPFLVSLHDLGKAAPGFQRVVPFLWASVEARGFVDAHPLWRGVRFRHDIESYAVLGEGGLAKWVEPVVTETTTLRRRRVILGVAQALGGHHGAFISAGEVQPQGPYPQVAAGSAAVGDQMWNAARQELAGSLARTFGIGTRMSVASGHLSAFCSVLNGFTVLCDWVASNEEYFPCIGEAPPDSYSALSWKRAQEAVESAGLLRFPEPSGTPTFSALFPSLGTPRPLQAALDADALQECVGPLLVVIEAPTGEGKTEAALLLAQRLAEHSSGGIYFALPTTATSEQLFKRVAAFFTDSHSWDGPAGLALIHGQADLSPEVRRLTQHDQRAAGDEATTEPVVIDSWLLPRKRALLAPYAVGTVDQAMMAALRVRHGSLRLLGLSGKVVIIDEVHAYDAYMNVIIERLLEWLSELGVSVVLLSATLPVAARQRLMSAYGVSETEEASVAYPLITLGHLGGVAQRLEPAAADPGRSVKIEMLESGRLLEALESAVAAATSGAAVGWVCDTVGSAQRAYLQLRAALGEAAAHSRPELLLYHARMLAGRRREVEKRVEALVGKQSPREAGCIIVATQVVEQSLDIDFDLLVSELAPVDLLLQRMGRLHRHRRERPSHVAEPVCRVLLPERLGEREREPLEWVYEPFILVKTLVALLGRESVSVPADVRLLVETVYDDAMPSAKDLRSVGVTAEAATNARMDLRTKRQVTESAARLHLLRAPDPDRFSESESGVPLLDDLTDEDVLGRESELGAQTRLTAPSVRVVVVDRGIDQLRDGAVLTRAVRVPDDLTRWLLDRSVSVSHPALLAHVASQIADRQPASFAKTPALRNHVLLPMVNGEYVWTVSDRAYRLFVEEALGVVIEEVNGG